MPKGVLTALKGPRQRGVLLIRELRSFQSLTGRINKNAVAEAVDMICIRSAKSVAIVACKD